MDARGRGQLVRSVELDIPGPGCNGRSRGFLDTGLTNPFATISLGGLQATIGELQHDSATDLALFNGVLSFDVTGTGGAAQVVIMPGSGDLSVLANIIFLDDDLRILPSAGTQIFLDGAISAGSQSLMMDGAGELWLRGDNAAWTGAFTANSGEVYLSHAAALGVANTSVVDGASVYIRVGSDEAFDVRAGGLWIDAGDHDGEVILSGGDLGTFLSGQLNGALVLTPNSGSEVGAAQGQTLTLTGGVSGTGDLLLFASGTVRFSTTGLTHNGDVVVNGGQVELLVGATHTGQTRVSQGTLLLNGAGSLVGSGGGVSVEAGGTLGVDRSAGGDALLNTVALNGVDLSGGSLLLLADLDPSEFLAGTSSGGALLVGSVPGFSAGSTNILDFGALPGGSALILGASGNSSLVSTLQLIPDSGRTLRLGAGTGTLDIWGVISDGGGTAVGLSHIGPGITRLMNANTFSGAVHIADGQIDVAHTMGLGTTDGATTVLDGGRLFLTAFVNESIIIDGGLVRLGVAGTFTNDWLVQSGTIESVAAGQIALSDSFEVGTQLSLRDTGGSGISLDGIVSGAGALTFDGGVFTLTASNTYLGVTTVQGDSQLDLLLGDALGDSSAGTVIQDTALVRLTVPSLEAFRISGGTLQLTDTNIDYTNPVTLGGGELRTPGPPGRGSVVLSGGLTMDGDGTLDVRNQVELTAQLTGTGDLTVFAESNLTFSGGIDLAGQILFESGDGLITMPQPVAVLGLQVNDEVRLLVEDDLTVSGTLLLDVVARLDWFGGQLQTGAFEIDIQNTTVGYTRLGLGVDLDLTDLSDGTLTGSPLVVTGDEVGDLPGFEIINGATVRQTGSDLVVIGDIWVGKTQETGTLRLEGGSLSANSVHVRGTTPNAIEIAGGTLIADLYLGGGTDSDGTLHLTSGQLFSQMLRVGSGGAGLVQQSGGTADINSLRFGDVAGSGGVYELSGTGVLNVNNLVFEEHANGIIRVMGGTMTLTGDVEDSYAGPGITSIEISGGTFNANDIYLRAWPNQISYNQTGGTANFSERLEMGFNSDFQFSGGTLNATTLVVDGQTNTVHHTAGDIVSEGMVLRARYNDADLCYEMSGGSITTHEGLYLRATASSSNGDGHVTFVQTGGTVTSTYRFYLGNSNAEGGVARYELSAGTLDVSGAVPAGLAYFGAGGSSGGRGEFIQTGGIAAFREVRLVDSLIDVSDGTLDLDVLDASSSDNAAPLFVQSGGQVAINTLFSLQNALGTTGAVVSGGALTVGTLKVGGDNSGDHGRFEQTGGTVELNFLEVAPTSVVTLGGGTMTINQGIENLGTIDFLSPRASLVLTGGLVNLTSGQMLNTTNANIVGLAGTVFSLPAGFDTATEFGSFTNAGVTHFQGDTLFIPIGPGLVAGGAINDLVQTQADITAFDFGSLELLGGVNILGGAAVDLGPEGKVLVSRPGSGIAGGSLSAQQVIVDAENSGPSAEFNMTGGSMLLESPTLGTSQDPAQLYMSASIDAQAQFTLTDGFISLADENQAALLTLETYGAPVSYEQSGGELAMSEGMLRFRHFSSDPNALARFEITGGVATIGSAELASGGDILVAGGDLTFTNRLSLKRDDVREGNLTATSGSLNVGTLILNSSGGTLLPSRMHLTGGTVRIGGEFDGQFQILKAIVQIDGGRLEAVELAMGVTRNDDGENYRQFIVNGGEVVVDTFVARGNTILQGDEPSIDLAGGLLEASFMVLGEPGDPVSARLNAPGTRLRVTDRLVLGDGLVLSAVEGATIHLDTATLEMESTSASNMAGLENLTLLMEGNADIEIGGQDMGATLAGFDNNFALRELVLGDDEIGLVRIVDDTNNALANTQDEALYVDRLILGAGSGINLNGLNIYYHQFIDLGGLVLTDGGSLIHVPLNILGDLSGDDFVGGEDLDILLANWGDSVTPGDLSLGDASGDGYIGVADLNIVTANWGLGITPYENVPEPTTALTLLLGSFLLSRRRRPALQA